MDSLIMVFDNNLNSRIKSKIRGTRSIIFSNEVCFLLDGDAFPWNKRFWKFHVDRKEYQSNL